MILAIKIFCGLCVAGCAYGAYFDLKRWWQNRQLDKRQEATLRQLSRDIADISEMLDRIELELSLAPDLEHIRALHHFDAKDWQ